MTEKRIYTYNGEQVLKIKGQRELLDKLNIESAVRGDDPWKPLVVFTKRPKMPEFAAVIRKSPDEQEKYNDEIQSKFKKVTMKEDGKIVIGDQGGWQAEWDKRALESERTFINPPENKMSKGCSYDTDNDGNCPFHPNGCPPERDWEVIEFKGSSRTSGYKLEEDGKYYCRTSPYIPNAAYNGEDFLTGVYSKSYHIHSVRRKSDNSIWTVGQQTNFGQIGAFQLSKDNLHMNVHFADPGDAVFIGHLKHPQPAKQPLFTTNDGVEIYPFSKYFLVCKDFEITECKTTNSGNFSKEYAERTFFRKNLAELWVHQNKPVELNLAYAGCNFKVIAKNKEEMEIFNKFFIK